MDKTIVSKNKLTAIANAIRTKTGKTEMLSLDEMPSEIEAIKDNGGNENEDTIISRSIAGIYTNNRITNIGQYTFRGCTKITEMNFEKAKSIDTNGIYGCTALVKVNMPALTSIGDNCFNNCTKLPSITLPLVTNIDAYAFRSCTSMTFVDLPLLGTLESSVFYGCSKLNTLVLRKADAICALSATNVFTNTPFAAGKAGGKCYVPYALIETYKTATNWSTLYAAGTCEFIAIEGSEYE